LGKELYFYNDEPMAVFLARSYSDSVAKQINISIYY